MRISGAPSTHNNNDVRIGHQEEIVSHSYDSTSKTLNSNTTDFKFYPLDT